MRFRVALSITTLFLVCFTVAVWASPATNEKSGTDSEERTITGKIASVGDAEFTVEVKQDQQMLKMKFLVDGNTKVEGKLSLGSTATVEYRSEGNNRIAAHVSVVPSSGLHAY